MTRPANVARQVVALVALVALLALASSLAVPAAHAQHAQPVAKSLAQSLSGSAKADYEAAKVLASDGDFAGALIKFQSAYEAAKDPRLLWNVAFCQKNLRHYAKVISTLQQYMADTSTALTDKDRKDAKELIQTIEPFTTRVTMHVTEDGAQISMDGELVGTSPLAAPIVVDIGERHIRVSKDGFVAFEKTAPFGGSAEVSLEVKLDKELHEGHLLVNAPAAATVFLDDQPIGLGKIDRSVPSGGHQLRVTAAGMRNFQSEIVIQDRETRSVEVVLEKEAEREKPRIRVMVGCDDSEPRGPDDGLVAYLDGPEVLQPVHVAKKWDGEFERNVVEHVEYSVAPGRHSLRLRIPGCDSLAQTVDVDATAGADLSGALESDTFVLFRGTQGSPGHWRVGLNAWFPAGGIRDLKPAQYTGQLGNVKGVTFTGAWLARWFGFTLEASVGAGSVRRDAVFGNYTVPDPTHAAWRRIVARLGPRLPFHAVSFSFGPGVGIQEFDLAKVRTGVPQAFFGGWAGLDVQPLCDWGLTLMADVYKVSAKNVSTDPIGSLSVGAFFQPNAQCRRERATRFGLRATPK